MSTEASNKEVILVHGLWYGPWTLRRLEKALSEQGYATRKFKYAPTSDCLDNHAANLHAFARDTDAGEQHFLGHSLGGLLILRMLADDHDIVPGRVLLLGTPLRGSVTARKIRRLPLSGVLLGEVRDVLEDGFSSLPPGRETGMIAGSRGFGLGMLTGGVGGPGDGTVGLDETDTEGLKDRIVLPVTHSGMLFSTEVVSQSVQFMNSGGFLRGAS